MIINVPERHIFIPYQCLHNVSQQLLLLYLSESSRMSTEHSQSMLFICFLHFTIQARGINMRRPKNTQTTRPVTLINP